MGLLDSVGAGAIGAMLIKIKPDGTDFQNDLEGITGKAGVNVGKAVGAASKAGLGAALAVGGGLLKLGTDLDSAYDNIRTKTGATGQELADLQGAFGNIAKQVPADLASVGDALTGVIQQLDVGGKAGEDLAVQFLNLAHITDTDVNAAIGSAAAVFQQFNVAVGDQSKTLDTFFQISQESGVAVNDLLDQVAKSGALFSQFGLGVTDGAKLLGLLEHNGLTARDATLGLTKVLQQAGKDGVAPALALQNLTDKIKGAKSEAEGTAIAIDAFGAKAGPKLAGQIRDGTLSLANLQDSMMLSGDSINDVAADTADASETFKKLKNNLAITLGPAANQLFNSFGKAATNMAPALLTVVKAFAPLLEAVTALPAPILAIGLGGLALGASFGKLVGPIKAVGSAIGGVSKLLATNPYILLIAATVALGYLIFKNWDKIKEVVGEALNFIGDILGKAFEGYKALVQAELDLIVGVFTTAFDGITSGVESAGEGIATAFSASLGAVSDVVSGFVGGVVAGFDGVMSAISSVVNFITGIPGAIGSVFTGLANLITLPFRAAFNGIAIAWNNTVGKLSFHLPGWIPGIGGNGFDVPDIPTFAKGGIMNRGLTGLVGERGPELFTAGDTGRITNTEELLALLNGRASADTQTGLTIQGPLLALYGPINIRSDNDITQLSRALANDAARALKAKGLDPVGASS